jgi:hypothetical protein
VFNFTSNIELYLSILKSLGLIIYLLISGKIITDLFARNIYPNKLYFLHIMIGFVFNSILIDFLILFNIKFNHNFLYILYFLIIISILYFLIIKFTQKLKFNYQYNFFNLFISFVIILYFLLSLAPITSADSLDYHLGVPIQIYKDGKHFNPLWFNAGLAGISDNFLIVSIITKAEQFGTLIQFFSLMSIIELFWLFKNKQQNNLKYIFISLIITIPVILFLVSSPKPQLTSIALAALIFFIILNCDLFDRKYFILISILVIYLSLTKINYILTSFFLFSMLFLKLKKKQKLTYLLIFFCIAIIIYIPFILYKIKIPGSSLYDILLPVPHNFPGYQSYISYLRGYSESNYIFPLSLLIPNGFGNITTIIGVNLFLLMYLFYKCNIPYNEFLILITLYLIFCIILGQRSSRFYLEIFLFLLIYIYHFGHFDKVNFSTFYVFQKVQLFIFTIVLIYSFFNLTMGSFSMKQRDTVLNNNADGYNLAKWVNTHLPDSVNLLLDHRSVTLFNQNIISADWSHYVKYQDLPFYDSIIKKMNLNYVVIINDTPKNSILYRYCNKLKYGPYNFATLNRNPFRVKKQNTAWIYESIK